MIQNDCTLKNYTLFLLILLLLELTEQPTSFILRIYCVFIINKAVASVLSYIYIYGQMRPKMRV